MKEACEPYERELVEEQLVIPRDEAKSRALPIVALGLAAIFLLGGYKLAVAHAKEHSTLAFLWIMMFGGAFVSSVACWALPRASHQGRAYLERLRLAYEGLEGQVDREGNWTGYGLEYAGARAGRPPPGPTA